MNRILTLIIGAALASQALVARAANTDPQFTLASPGSVLTGYVTGSAVPITVSSTAPIPAHAPADA